MRNNILKILRAGLALTTAMTKLCQSMTLVNREVSIEIQSTGADVTAANTGVNPTGNHDAGDKQVKVGQLECFCFYADPL